MKRITAGHAFILLGLVLSLTGCGYETTSEAIAAYKAEGKIDKIILLLADPIQANRIEAIQALGEIKSKEALVPLTDLFHDPDKIVVHEAIDAVVEIGGPEIEPYMLEAITLDTVPAREAGAKALGSFKSDEAVDALILALDDYKYEQIVLAAMKSLGEIGNPRAVEPLSLKLKERSYAIREACISSLLMIGDEAALQSISTRLGDVKAPIRDAAIQALKGSGAEAVPVVLEALRSESHLARAGALDILKEEDVVPASGSDLVWYRLAELTVEEKPEIDPAKAEVLASIEDNLPALLEALMHLSPAIREYASVALENIGEPAVEAVMAHAEENATELGLTWFNSRSEWNGAPSWRLDLWGAAVAVNPKFKINEKYVELLAKGGNTATKVMNAQQFRPDREIIPFLLYRLVGTTSKDKDQKAQVETCRKLAMKHLSDDGYKAVFPLVAALSAENPEIATYAAQVLKAIGGERVEQIIIAEYTKQLEPVEVPQPEETEEPEEGVAVAADPADPDAEEVEPVVIMTKPNDELSGTSLHNAILEFDIPALVSMRLEIRPDAVEALHEFKAKFPGMTVISLPLGAGANPTENEVPFKLSYYKNQQMNEINVIYRRNSANQWVINPPLPAELP